MSREYVFMKCGCTANARRGGEPSCATHFTTEQAPAPDLTGRMARCAYDGRMVASELGLPFFSYRPGDQNDDYYCGCKGWD